MAAHGVLVAKGKFDQFGQRQPLSVLLGALGQAVAAVGELPAELHAAAAARLREVLGTLAGVLTAALPGLQMVIGTPPPGPELGGEASRARHELALHRLVAGLAEAEMPLVIFIDDLHWADARSLELLAGLLDDPSLDHLLLIGSCRADSVAADHPLGTWFQGSRESAEQRVRRIGVEPSTEADFSALLKVIGVADGSERQAAAQVLAGPCAGNPFTALQALHVAADAGAMRPGLGVATWTIDVAALRGLVGTDDMQALVLQFSHDVVQRAAFDM